MSEAQHRPPAAIFRAQVESAARAILAHHPRATEAAARVGLAFAAAARAARDPSALYGCTPASVAGAIAQCALADLYPGGHAPAVYLVPQAARRDEAPELQWRLTHRGMSIIAARAGWGVHTVPVSRADLPGLRVDFGEVLSCPPSDPTAAVTSWDDLAGVVVVIRPPAPAQRVALWVPVGTIAARRRASRMAGGGPWQAWPVQMAQGAAIREVVARGALPLDLPDDSEAGEAEVQPAAIAAPPAQRMLPELPPDFAPDDLPAGDLARVADEGEAK